ncbi:MAG: bifunctional phosphoribosylaminoimidazolecarboxamide formyltransferase/IMP cyclohydrolase [Chitinophagales bacterium]
MSSIKVKKALLSVSDKTGLIPLAKTLQSFGCEIISTGGTGKKLAEADISYTDISKVTGNPEAFGGRMKTISFHIESALLFDRERDAEEAAGLNIEAIDMVVCNLYPFKKVLEAGADFETLIENIDIGGPTMVRAAAKNFKYVATITDPNSYENIIAELEENDGALTYETRHELMRIAFNHTADYDAMIAEAMDKSAGEHSIRLSFTGGKTLRYGENSHQSALYFKEVGAPNSLYDMEILHGKALSFNNILDIHGAIESVRTLNRTACSVIKHSNPCGLCEGENQRTVLEATWAGDPISAFGSIIAFNQKVEKSTVEFLDLDKKASQRKFVEVIVGPSFSDDALEYLQLHKDLRVIGYDINAPRTGKDLRYMNGSLLVQDLDVELHSKIETVTTASIEAPDDLVEFGLKAISNIKSNAIVVVRRKGEMLQLLGMGAGQPNRLIASKLALEKCGENLTNEYRGAPEGLETYIREELSKTVLISDAFFPFPDNVELAHEYGIKAIVQPGGSIRDNKVIDKCNELGVTMIFTGLRHFKH